MWSTWPWGPGKLLRDKTCEVPEMLYHMPAGPLGLCFGFGFGSGKHGQVGTSEDGISRLFSFPTEDHHFENDSVVGVCANGDQSASINCCIPGAEDLVGKLTGGIQQIVSSLKFSQVSHGWNHTFVLAECGELLMLGGYHHGKLSCSQEVRLKQQQQEPSSRSSINETSAIPILQKVPYLERKNNLYTLQLGQSILL